MSLGIELHMEMIQFGFLFSFSKHRNLINLFSLVILASTHLEETSQEAYTLYITNKLLCAYRKRI